MTRVFIVDDDPQITGLLSRFLARTGRFQVRTENRSCDAAAAAADFRPDVVLLDVCMPGLDGPEVASAIEAVPGLEDVPILFLTGLATPDEVGPRGCVLGSRMCLPKPIGLGDLVRRLDESVA